MSGTVIVGGGQGGAQAAISLREVGYTKDVTLLCGERHLPYQRPPLSKDYLSGKSAPESLTLRKADYYERQGIRLVLDTRVVDLTLPQDLSDRGSVETEAGDRLTFDHAVLALGGRPRSLEIPGGELDGVHYLRTIGDADRLRAAMSDADHVTVVGGGFVGLEAAAMARAWGKQVLVLEAAQRLLARSVAPFVSDFLAEAHRRRGTSLLMSTSVEQILGEDGTISSVVLSSGEVIDTDLVVVGVGMRPHTELALRAGLDVRDGIVVDADSRTSDPRVFAVGDCTLGPVMGQESTCRRLESVQSAIDQARNAAAAIAGTPAPAKTVPWFWSYQGDLRLQMAGLAEEYDEVSIAGSPDVESFSVSYLRDNQLVALHALNRPADFMAAKKQLTQWARQPALHPQGA